VRRPPQAVLLLSLLLALPRAVLAAQAPADADWKAATGAFDRLVKTDSIVGGTLALVREGQIVRRHDVGAQDRAADLSMGPRAIMHWGSITKTLTAVAILQLRDRGLLSLEDPITRWIPDLRQVHNPYGSMDGITLRMLLSHSSGFQNPTWPYRRYVSWEPFEPTRWEQLLSMMPYQEIRFPPGSRYGYSNPAFIYLARVIESITGDPYQSYIYKNLWIPLGIMESSFGATPWPLRPFRSSNYTLVGDSLGRERLIDNGREFDPGITIPNGGWNAPVTDLAKWMGFLSGASRGDPALRRSFEMLLARTTLEEMWRPVVPMGDAGEESVGLGFFLRRVGAATLVGHTGEQAGFRSFAYFNPVTRVGVIGCVNTTNDARPEESGRAFAAAIGAAVTLIR
jgi:CubicO group peptidase (beta-lactamase class C family)